MIITESLHEVPTEKVKRLVLILFVASAMTVGAADAKENWGKHCAECHGTDGKGDTQMGKKLGVRDFSNPRVQAEMQDAKMSKTIKEGIKAKNPERTKMKAFGELLSEDEINALLAYIRSLKK